MMVGLLDYGSGNIGSVANLLRYMNVPFEIVNDVSSLNNYTHYIMPGVGAFGYAMEKIRSTFDLNSLNENILVSKKPFLGICVGMQILADEGHEFGVYQGLGWIRGKVRQLNSAQEPLPHIGWNDIKLSNSAQWLHLQEKDFYFVHSFCFDVDDEDAVVARTDYGEEFVSVVKKDNIWGVQFHPEKSLAAGQTFMKRFLES